MILHKLEISLKEFIRSDRFVEIVLLLGILFNLINWGLVYYRFSRFLAGQTESIILHYNIYFGIDKVGEWTRVYNLPLIGIIILLVNTVIAYLLYSKNRLLSYFIISATLLMQILLNLATFYIVVVNQY